jgi:ABC-type nitrate/sulfonate/bicarbonate transport system ATPase subunit
MPFDFINVGKTFKRETSRIIAVENLSLHVDDGEFVCILGPSGCGKSTLLFMAAGLENSSGGRVVFNGRDVTGPGADRGMLFQQFALYPWLSARKNVEFGLSLRGVGANERWKRAKHWLDLMGLTPFADAYPHQLSGGMQQRVAIARLLVNEPQIMLMDEPFAALDAQTRTSLGEELVRVWQEAKGTVLFVTHSIDEAILLADRLVIMTPRPGRIKMDMRIDIPRPRDPASDDFNALRRRVTDLLRHDIHSTIMK